ncbi:TIGR04086 family membrane protein [Paenibacillus algorifonticola]|uniref:TIGR04086 family membrane protein n=1 Tax=Paenibacillus algorifonticola TaxID=684063 RepID=UPI003D2A22D2
MNPIKHVPRPPQIASPILAGLLYAIIWLALGALLLSLLLHFGNMKESSLPAFATCIHGMSAFAGGLTSGKRSGMKGWYQGGLLGLLYGLTILLIGFLAADAGFSLHTALVLGITLLLGAFGGVIGVNLKK